MKIMKVKGKVRYLHPVKLYIKDVEPKMSFFEKLLNTGTSERKGAVVVCRSFDPECLKV